jgi:adenine-specific DNA-methyltransferase
MTDMVELESKDLVKDNIDKLKQIFPDIVTDGKIDFDTLKLILGEVVEKDKESYKFEWSGKTDCYKTIQSPSLGTLKPQKEESIDFDNSENLIIEGDNLEVLKLLQSNYSNKIKIIYIDPPYNTGKEFIYNDNYTMSLDNYFEQTGQTEKGESTQSNKSKEGRKHTQWLNMIYPRLLLSKSLLTEDGVIFISIDDNEVKHMRMICDDIFGEENLIGTITWEKRTKSQNTTTSKDMFQSKTEYILVYKKYNDKMRFNLEITSQKDYNLTDSNGKYRLHEVEEMSSLGMRGRETMIYSIKDISPSENKQWKIGKDKIKFFEDRDDIEIVNNKPYMKLRPEDEDNSNFQPFWSHFFDKSTYGTAETGKSELSNVLGTNEHGFETVKPTKLIKKLLFHIKKTENISVNNNDIILDFFGGSGTTGQSVLELNKEDNGNRKFILVQLPEITNNPDYPTICDITKERIRRVIKGYGDNPQPINNGFKVFKLDKSNYIINEKLSVNPNTNREDLINQLRNSLLNDNHLIEGYKNIDIVYEVILKEGYSLNSKVQEIKVLNTNIYKVVDDSKKCYITFDSVDTDILKDKEFTGISKDTLFVCLDKGLTDSDKSNLSLTFQLKTI